MGVTGWQRELRERGYRLTPQRQLVLESVGRLGHATPEEIVTDVNRIASGVNISTVYRTLELLEGLGLVIHVHLGHGASTYHAVGGEKHLHLVCGRCGKVDETAPDVVAGLVDDLRARGGFELNVDHMTLHGLCRECAALSRT